MVEPVGIREVAARAGVSKSTVSNVLNRPDRVSSDAVARVHAAIKELGFVRNDAARQLRVGHSKSIGMVLFDIRNPYFAELARGAEAAAEERGYAVLIGNSDQSAAREQRYLDLFEEHRVAGVLISPRGDISAQIRRLRAKKLPTVLFDRSEAAGVCCYATNDDIAGGRTAAEHLLERGRRRLFFVGGPADVPQYADRLEGVRQAVTAVPGATLDVIAVEQPDARHAQVAGEALARNWSGAPDGIISSNDLVALGLLHALTEAGIRVPEDVGIVGHDDIQFAEGASVPLTSVKQPAEAIGRAAVELLLREIDEGDEHVHRRIVFEPELVARRSS